MSNWLIYHKGTGTYFSIDQDVVAIDVSTLTDDEFDSFFNEVNGLDIANTHGKQLSDELMDTIIEKENNNGTSGN